MGNYFASMTGASQTLADSSLILPTLDGRNAIALCGTF